MKKITSFLKKHIRFHKIEEFSSIVQYLRVLLIRPPVIIHGSYNTSNVGDKAIGETIKKSIEDLFNLDCETLGYYHSAQTFRRFEYYIIGGGGIIHDFAKNNLANRLTPFGSASKNIVLGVGVSGIRTTNGKKLIKKLESADLITVRDEYSKNILSKYINKKIHVTACPAFLLEPTNAKAPSNNQKKCGISLRDWFNPVVKWKNISSEIPLDYYPKDIDHKIKKEEYINFIKNNLYNLQKEYKLYFIPFHLDDIKFAHRYLTNLNIKVYPVHSPIRTLNLINTMDRMICMRYHSLIFSIIAEKPLFVIDYCQKTKEITNRFDINSIDINNINFKEKLNFFESLEKIKDIKNIMRERAQQNFLLLKNITTVQLKQTVKSRKR
jgi:polysaccharide pyruvyl transferase WcaK-like protein